MTAAAIDVRRPAKQSRRLLTLFQIAPLAVVLAFFLIVPILMIVVVSFWKFNGFASVPDFVLTNYVNLLSSTTTVSLYLNTGRLLLATLIGTILVGYVIAYHLAFDIRRPATQTFMFALCVVPFLTSAVIRTIAWIPFLGKNGIVNSALIQLRLIDEPLSFLLFSDFAIVLCYVLMFAGFMVAPILNLMMRIEPSIIEAARDSGATGFQIFRWIVFPLTAPGAAIGAIFVIVMTISDVATARLVGGGQTGTAAIAVFNQVSLVQFPPACAAAVLMLVVVLVIVVPILRFVDIRRQL